ncbi:MAG: hypothetical protein IT265_00010 [Saprospiraceae bacterium]|nr:hypothetical protein [Saprospiraceae bacterium]
MKQILGILACAFLMANCSNGGTQDGKLDSTQMDTSTHKMATPEETQMITPDTLNQGKTDTAKNDNKGNSDMGTRKVMTSGG